MSVNYPTKTSSKRAARYNADWSLLDPAIPATSTRLELPRKRRGTLSCRQNHPEVHECFFAIQNTTDHGTIRGSAPSSGVYLSYRLREAVVIGA
jgi:hypothetical protein